MAIHMSQAFIDDASDHQALQIHRVSHGVVAADVGMHPVAATGGIVKPVIETIFNCAGEVKYAVKQFCPSERNQSFSFCLVTSDSRTRYGYGNL